MTKFREDDIDTDKLDWSKAKRGPVVPPESGKERITIRLDSAILSYFRNKVRAGGNYQTLINDALRAHIEGERLERRLRRIVRQEMERVHASRSSTTGKENR